MDIKLARQYYDPSNPSAFSTLAKLQAAFREAKGKQPSPRVTQDWLHQQDAYTLHKPVTKRFFRNPYSVNNVMDVWEYDLLAVQNLSRYNDNYKFLLMVIDVFSKFLHVEPLKIKPAPPSHQRFSPFYRIRNIINRTNAVPSYCELIKAKKF
jgi:hypothetical protein